MHAPTSKLIKAMKIMIIREGERDENYDYSGRDENQDLILFSPSIMPHRDCHPFLVK